MRGIQLRTMSTRNVDLRYLVFIYAHLIHSKALSIVSDDHIIMHFS